MRCSHRAVVSSLLPFFYYAVTHWTNQTMEVLANADDAVADMKQCSIRFHLHLWRNLKARQSKRNVGSESVTRTEG